MKRDAAGDGPFCANQSAFLSKGSGSLFSTRCDGRQVHGKG